MKLIQKTFDSLLVQVYEDPASMGQAAASFVAKELQKSISQKNTANLVLATGASQFSFLKALKSVDSINWSHVTTFHLDEYVGISPDHSASFRKYLLERIIDRVRPSKSYFLQGDADDLQAEIARYEQLLCDHPIDVACIGIGENGHLAFNDPPVADFNDPSLVKVVDLDEASRMQQVGEGWFERVEDVPTRALSLTIPAIMQSCAISCLVVPINARPRPFIRPCTSPFRHPVRQLSCEPIRRGAICGLAISIKIAIVKSYD